MKQDKFDIVIRLRGQPLVVLQRLLNTGFYGRDLDDAAERVLLVALREMDFDREATAPAPAPMGHPRTWDKAKWEECIARCRTRRQVAAYAGIDERTLNRYLAKVGVKPHWRRNP